MTKEELLGKLQMVYVGDTNALNELIGYYDGLKQCIEELQQENKILKENAENNDKVVDKVNWENQLFKKENEQLKDNWNELKEYCKNNYYGTTTIGILDKMQELEGKDGEN